MFEDIKTVAVYVTDKERAKEFYTRVLGFELVVDLGPDLCFLRSKSGAISVYLEGGMQPSTTNNRATRLSFFLQAEQSAADTYAALKGAGVRLFQEAPEPVDENQACFQFADPDGNILEVCGKR